MDFEEFAAAAISIYQLESLDTWEQHARRGYEFFEKDGNRPIMIEELASVNHLTFDNHSPEFCTCYIFNSLLKPFCSQVDNIVLFSQELGLGPSVPVHVVLQDWIRHADGKLSFLGFVKLLHGVSSRLIPKAQ